MILQKQNTVAFDPSNPRHRIAVASFMKRTAWADSDFRFTHDPAFGSVADQVKVKMLHWYIAQDTGITVESAARPLIARGLHAVM
jgi:hypothetical protein